mmetsp:Transcript_20003/g.50881  ORF Transcript_20003/g.50881 Transcript_20003/m.50881 type:complete len:111 (-) Transcript_20003:784-1116(-)
MHFCPPCGNMLLLETVNGRLRFYCQTCPYIYNLRATVSVEVPLEHKNVDDVLGGPEAWKNADQSDGKTCSSCLSPCIHHTMLSVCLLLRSQLPQMYQSSRLLPAATDPVR